MDDNSLLILDGGKLVNAENGVYEYGVDITKNPINTHPDYKTSEKLSKNLLSMGFCGDFLEKF